MSSCDRRWGLGSDSNIECHYTVFWLLPPPPSSFEMRSKSEMQLLHQVQLEPAFALCAVRGGACFIVHTLLGQLSPRNEARPVLLSPSVLFQRASWYQTAFLPEALLAWWQGCFFYFRINHGRVFGFKESGMHSWVLGNLLILPQQCSSGDWCLYCSKVAYLEGLRRWKYWQGVGRIEN